MGIIINEGMTDEMDNIALQFIGELINEREAQAEGYSMPVRWLCLRDDLREKYLEEARHWAGTWWADEQAAKLSRDNTVPVNYREGEIKDDPPRNR
mgnify:CR=1 FL=1